MVLKYSFVEFKSIYKLGVFHASEELRIDGSIKFDGTVKKWLRNWWSVGLPP